MRFTRLLTVGLLLLGGALALPAAVKNVVVINFPNMPRSQDGARERGYEYSFGDWEGKKVTQIPDKGLLVNLLGSKGGVGENRGLDFRKHTLARITLIIGNRNQAESFGLALVDKDDTEHSWDVSLKGQAKGVPLELLVDLAHPSREDKPGKTPGLDLKKLKTWQIKGNYQSAPIEVLFVKVTAVSE